MARSETTRQARSLVQGDRDTGERMIGEAADLAHQIGDEQVIAYALHARGMAALFDGDLNGASGCFTKALELFRQAHVRNGELFTLFTLGLTLGTRHREDGLAVLEECVRATTETGDVFWRSYALWAIAHIEYVHGFLAHAEEADMQALRLQRVLDDRLALAL